MERDCLAPASAAGADSFLGTEVSVQVPEPCPGSVPVVATERLLDRLSGHGDQVGAVVDGRGRPAGLAKSRRRHRCSACQTEAEEYFASYLLTQLASSD